MADAPCGCERIAKARRATTMVERETLKLDGAAMQQAWRCPYAGHQEPDGAPVDLSPGCVDAIECVGRVTGLDTTPLRTCPRWYASQPFAHEATLARLAAERGETSVRYGGDPPNVIVEAVALLDNACGERAAYDVEAMKRKHPIPPPSANE